MNCKDKASRLAHVLVALAIAILLGSCRPHQDLPAARYGARMIFDPVENQTILFGGRAEGLLGLRYFNDLWIFDYTNQIWTPLKTTHRPAARLSPGMVYDPEHHQIILFGGHSAQGRLGDTWTYKIAENQWQEVSPTTSPPPRSDAGMAYDETSQRVILFSGYCQEGSRGLCGDTWAFDPGIVTWTEMRPTSSPPIMYGHTLVYDDSNRRSLLWGGHMAAIRNGTVSSIGYGNTIWSYDYPENRWEQIEEGNTNSPVARYWNQSTFDSSNANLFLFGGDGGHGFLDDTWLLKVMDNTWERVSTEASPSPRVNSAITYDPVNEVVVLFGGLGEGGTDLGDTWVFRETETGGGWVNISPSPGR